MRLHPQTRIVQQAGVELDTSILDLEDKLEIISIFLEGALDMKKYALRAEQHPDEPNKKADEE